jgi:uncharacterized membrane protein
MCPRTLLRGHHAMTADSRDEKEDEDSQSGTERLLAFSDGVFAIAITLLVLNITLPGHSPHLAQALKDLFPQYASYVISFTIIGIIWAQHHTVFTLIRSTDHVFLLINILFLGWIAFLPFPTHVLGVSLGTHDEGPAMVFYAGTFLAGAIFFNLLWRYPAWNGRLLRADADPHLVAVTNRSYLFGPIIYAVDLALAFYSATASLILFFLVSILYAVAPIRQVGMTRLLRPLSRPDGKP